MRPMKMVSTVALFALLFLPTLTLAQGTDGQVVQGFTPGRLWASIDAVVGLIGAILAGLSLSRIAARPDTWRRVAILAGVVGMIVIAYAALHLTLFTGGFGTGGGRAGALVAIAMGLTSVILASMTLSRARRAG